MENTKKFRLEKLVDGEWYVYGTYTTRDKANEVANWLMNMGSCENTYISEVE